MSAELKKVTTQVAVQGESLVEAVQTAYDQLVMQGFTEISAATLRGNDRVGFMVLLEGEREIDPPVRVLGLDV